MCMLQCSMQTPARQKALTDARGHSERSKFIDTMSNKGLCTSRSLWHSQEKSLWITSMANCLSGSLSPRETASSAQQSRLEIHHVFSQTTVTTVNMSTLLKGKLSLYVSTAPETEFLWADQDFVCLCTRGCTNVGGTNEGSKENYIDVNSTGIKIIENICILIRRGFCKFCTTGHFHFSVGNLIRRFFQMSTQLENPMQFKEFMRCMCRKIISVHNSVRQEFDIICAVTWALGARARLWQARKFPH